MKLLGAKVVTVNSGQKTLKDAVDAALIAYIEQPESFYLLGSVVGPHPYPSMVRDFQQVIGQEVKQQMLKAEDRLPDYLVACVGGGSNAMGLFTAFLEEPNVRLVAVEPAGKGEQTQQHGLALAKGKVAQLHGFKSKVLQDDQGKIKDSYSAASGLDYPGVGPQLSYLVDLGRLELANASDQEAVKAFVQLSRLEGIIPALESAHALAHASKLAKQLSSDTILVVNLSGRGDKDVENVYENFLAEK